MALVGVLVCVVAAYALRATPLAGPAVAVAATHVAASVFAVVLSRRGGAPRAFVTALRHITVALGAFFLFVSVSLP